MHDILTTGECEVAVVSSRLGVYGWVTVGCKLLVTSHVLKTGESKVDQVHVAVVVNCCLCLTLR